MSCVVQMSEEEEYQLIVESNRIVAEIDDETLEIQRFVRDLYAKRFPELEVSAADPALPGLIALFAHFARAVST